MIIGGKTYKLSSDAEVEFKSVHEYSEANKAEIERLDVKCKADLKLSEETKQQIERYNSKLPPPLSEDGFSILVDEQNEICKEAEKVIKKTRGKLEAMRETYQKHYSQWQPIYGILKKAVNEQKGIKSIDYPDINFFLKLCEKFYKFSPSKINSLDYEPASFTPEEFSKPKPPSTSPLNPNGPSIFFNQEGGGGSKEEHEGLSLQ